MKIRIIIVMLLLFTSPHLAFSQELGTNHCPSVEDIEDNMQYDAAANLCVVISPELNNIPLYSTSVYCDIPEEMSFGKVSILEKGKLLRCSYGYRKKDGNFKINFELFSYPPNFTQHEIVHMGPETYSFQPARYQVPSKHLDNWWQSHGTSICLNEAKNKKSCSVEIISNGTHKLGFCPDSQNDLTPDGSVKSFVLKNSVLSDAKGKPIPLFLPYENEHYFNRGLYLQNYYWSGMRILNDGNILECVYTLTKKNDQNVWAYQLTFSTYTPYYPYREDLFTQVSLNKDDNPWIKSECDRNRKECVFDIQSKYTTMNTRLILFPKQYETPALTASPGCPSC